VIHKVFLKPDRLIKRSTDQQLKIQIEYDSSLDGLVIDLYFIKCRNATLS